VITGVGLGIWDREPSTAHVGATLIVGFGGQGHRIVLHLLSMRVIGAARQAALRGTSFGPGGASPSTRPRNCPIVASGARKVASVEAAWRRISRQARNP